MNIYDIKNKACEYTTRPLLMVMVAVGLINFACSLFESAFTGMFGSLLSMIFLVATVALNHGTIVAAMATIYNKGEEINVQETTLVGIYRFRNLAPTYLLHMIVVNIVGLLFGFIVAGLVFVVVGFDKIIALFTQLQSLLSMQGELTPEMLSPILASVEIVDNPFIFILISIIFVAVIVLTVLINCRLSLFPYIVEKYGITGKAALLESSRLMKGNVWTLIKLELSFLGRMILCAIVVMLAGMLLGSYLGMLISIILEIVIYGKDLALCHAIFYEELDLEDKNLIYEGETVNE